MMIITDSTKSAIWRSKWKANIIDHIDDITGIGNSSREQYLCVVQSVLP